MGGRAILHAFRRVQAKVLERTDKHPTLVPVALAVAAYLLGFGLLLVGGVLRSSVMVILAGFVLLGAAFRMHGFMRRHREIPRSRRGIRIIAPLVMVAVGIGIFGAGEVVANRPVGWGFFGVTVFFAGIGHLLDEYRWRPRNQSVTAVAGLVVCAALFVVGILGARFHSEYWLYVAAAAIVLAPVALSLVTDRVATELVRLRRPPVDWQLLAIGGAMVLLGLILLLAWTGLPLGFVAAAAVVLFVLVGAIASRTEVDVVLVVVTVALAWSVMPRIVERGDELQPAANQNVLVALGDSYMSGEGAQEYYRGTNDEGTNECRQAPTAYAHLALAHTGPEFPEALAFHACSAAKADHIHKVPQPPYNKLQLDSLKAELNNAAITISLVIVSIGGNDAQFGKIGRACVAPGDCTVWGQKWLNDLAAVAPKIDEAYQKIRTAVGDEVPILVVPYPVPLNEQGCDWSLLTASEHKFLYGYTRELNKVVQKVAEQKGLHYLDQMPQALEQRQLRICDGKPEKMGANSVAISSVRGLFEEKLTPVNWFHNSLHPNERGHQAMRDVLVAWMDSHQQPTIKADPGNDTGPPAIASLDAIMGQPTEYCGSAESAPRYCDRGVAGWSLAQVTELVLRALIPLLLVVGGWWLCWLAVLNWTKPRRWLARQWSRIRAA